MDQPSSTFPSSSHPMAETALSSEPGNRGTEQVTRDWAFSRQPGMQQEGAEGGPRWQWWHRQPSMVNVVDKWSRHQITTVRKAAYHLGTRWARTWG